MVTAERRQSSSPDRHKSNTYIVMGQPAMLYLTKSGEKVHADAPPLPIDSQRI